MGEISIALNQALSQFVGRPMTEELLELLKEKSKRILEDLGVPGWNIRVEAHGNVMNVHLDYEDEGIWRY